MYIDYIVRDHNLQTHEPSTYLGRENKINFIHFYSFYLSTRWYVQSLFWIKLLLYSYYTIYQYTTDSASNQHTGECSHTDLLNFCSTIICHRYVVCTVVDICLLPRSLVCNRNLARLQSTHRIRMCSEVRTFRNWELSLNIKLFKIL